MNNAFKFGLKFAGKQIINSCRNSFSPKLNWTVFKSASYSRALWHMCSTSRVENDFLKPKPLSECCQCGCSGLIHTGGEHDLVEFLKEEIMQEKKAQKMKSLPAELDGFAVSSNMAELVLEKKNQYETVILRMNVNHSVDAEETLDEGGLEEMKSRPSFDIDLVRNKKTLSFTCSFTQFNEGNDSEAGDMFQINEVTYFEGDWDDKTYSVAADILDENLYDLFMVVLTEKGLTRQFMEKVSELATSHEHSQYISLLENVRKFASAN